MYIRATDFLTITLAARAAESQKRPRFDIINPDQNVTKILQELEEGAAERRQTLNALAWPDRYKAPTVEKNDLPAPSVEVAIPPLTFEWPAPDPNQSQYRLTDLLAYHDLDFVHHAYRAVLKREPDPRALTEALDGLRTGRFNRVDLLSGLSSSEEAKEKRVHISGLRFHAAISRLCRLPVLRQLTRPLNDLLHWSSIVRQQQRSTVLMFDRQERITQYLNETVLAHIASVFPVLHQILDRLEEHESTHKEILERIQDLNWNLDARVNEEAMQRQQEYKDRNAEIEDLRRVYNKYRTQVELTEKELKREMEHLFRKYQEVKTELVFQNQRMATPAEERRGSTPSEKQPTTDGHALDAFFASFDEQFRGKRADVKQRLRTYLPLITNHGIGSHDTPILDVACGRGEWLELLKEEKLCASGVEANSVLAAQCRERGLEVTESDLNEYLRALPDCSLGAVTAFHIVEHLSIEELLVFLDQSLRVLRSGGLILLETPNPKNVLVGSCNFYFDPTHRNPLPDPVLKFLVESRGFMVIETFGLNPSDEKPVQNDSELARRFNEYFYGPMDYAIVAQKI